MNRLDGVSLLIQAGDVDPYKSLRPVFPEYGKEEVDKIKGLEELNDGGAALTAYNYLQYSNITDKQRGKLREACNQKYNKSINI